MKTLSKINKNDGGYRTTQKSMIGSMIKDSGLHNTTKSISQSNLSNYWIDIVPDKSLLGRIGESGHTFYEAIAEFIDNSIDAKTIKQKTGLDELIINIIINVSKKYFSITDNGKGMNRKTLANCAKLGHSEKTALELGYAGIGIKSGALTLGNNFIVKTGTKNDSFGNEFEYDEKEFLLNKNGWEIPAKSYFKDINVHGTMVIVKNVNKINLVHTKIQYLKNDIAKRYRSFIEKGNVVINVNGQKVIVSEVNWGTGYPIDFNIPTKYGEIYGKIGLMNESSQKGYYGFDIFRNGRMIVTNSKFAIGTHPTTARISGEIHLNFVKVSHEKNKFLTETLEYSIAEESCKNSKIFKTILREARKKSEDINNKKENNSINEYINENIPIISYAIKELEYNVPTSVDSGKGISPIKNGNISKKIFDFVESKKYKTNTEKENNKNKSTKANKNKDDDSVDIIELNGQKYKIKLDFFNEVGMGRKKTLLENGVLNIYINSQYAGFILTKDKNSYCLETVQDAIIETMFVEHQKLMDEINERKENLITAIYKYREYFKETFTLDKKEEIELEQV